MLSMGRYTQIKAEYRYIAPHELSLQRNKKLSHGLMENEETSILVR